VRRDHALTTLAKDLYGSAPDSSPVVVLLLDVINHFEHEDGVALLESATAAAPHIEALNERARAARVPVVYANDNWGRWRSNLLELLEYARGTPGGAIVERLAPRADDYFVLKPAHSGFYETTLTVLLEHLHARTLVLAGWTTDICVLFTAIDAYMRGYRLILASDAVAAVRPEHTRDALAYAARVLRAGIQDAAAIDFAALGSSDQA
jgi:nicotinamidase-related amidase